MKNYFRKPPAQPPESSWQFVEELQAPLHQYPISWSRKVPPRGMADLRSGVILDIQFPDPDALLDTAYADFRRFLRMGAIPERGACRIVTAQIKTDTPETYRLETTSGECRLLAGDTEGIRRGLVMLEDQMQINGGAFLKTGITQKTPLIRTRISRCFYSPIHRPPKNRDELVDDVNYYPDEYLNRLAHDGVNGLWIYTHFDELLPSSIIPEYGHDSARRLEKLRRVVHQCRRFGIRIYVFCIEPTALRWDSPVAKAHPELHGGTSGKTIYFCPSTKQGQAYLEEATHTLFAEVPHLGGIIDITVGERATSCATQGAHSNCPRCSKHTPPETLAKVLKALERGMHAVAPEAELISWPYGQLSAWGKTWTIAGAAAVPPGVALQLNFEQGGRARQLGKLRTARDYFLSYIGPSDVFKKCARQALANGTRMFAKLQVGNSHEVATTPFVPVPGNLYRKYRAMHKLGVSGVMQCWYFGNYPSPMTKAAGLLSFAPFPKTEKAFLMTMAQRDWGQHAGQAVNAWQFMQAGYANYPLTTLFGYFGPMHDGVVWPLHLKPVDASLAPTWQIGHPLSGDRIAECFAYTHTFEEILILCRRLVENWTKGVRILESLMPKFKNQPERLAEIRVAQALGIQFQSGLNILRFYHCREKLLTGKGHARLRMLVTMRRLAQNELCLDQQMLGLLAQDSRLGFHSEAEGYKYFPALIRWRMRQLRGLLKKDFPQAAADIRAGKPLFPDLVAPRSKGAVYHCRLAKDAGETIPSASLKYEGLRYACETEILPGHEPPGDRATTWQAVYDKQALIFTFICREPEMNHLKAVGRDRQRLDYMLNDMVEISWEPRLFWPCIALRVNCAGARFADGKPNYDWQAHVQRDTTAWQAQIRVPWHLVGQNFGQMSPIRLNLTRYLPGRELTTSVHTYRWVRTTADLTARRRRHGTPVGQGWLCFER